MIEHLAQIKEVRVSCGPLRQCHRTPLIDELSGGDPIGENGGHDRHLGARTSPVDRQGAAIVPSRFGHVRWPVGKDDAAFNRGVPDGKRAAGRPFRALAAQ